MRGPTRLHLVRHAHTDAVGVVLAGRAPGVSLNEQGRHEAAILGHAFAEIPARAIFTSPQLRTRQTANCIAAALSLTPRTEPALDEIDFGDWTGKRFDELDGQPAWLKWNTHRSIAESPGGETMLAVQCRAMAFVQEIERQQEAGDVILVSHGDVLKSICVCILGMSLNGMQQLEIAPASHSILLLSNGSCRVQLLNRTYAG